MAGVSTPPYPANVYISLTVLQCPTAYRVYRFEKTSFFISFHFFWGGLSVYTVVSPALARRQPPCLARVVTGPLFIAYFAGLFQRAY